MPCYVLLNTAFELTLQGFFPLSNVTGNFSLFSTLKQNKACHLWYYADLENVAHRCWSQQANIYDSRVPELNKVYEITAILRVFKR